MLYSAMLSTDSDARVLACELWGPIGNRAAVQPLRQALLDRSPYVRIAAAASLFKLGDPSGAAELEALIQDAPARAPGRTPDARELMRLIARNKIRVEALRALSLMDPKASLQALEKAASDPDAAVRDAALVALARAGRRQGSAPIAAALSDEDPQVRAKAARALGEIGGPESVGPLRRAAGDPVSSVRAAALESLGELADPAALPELTAGASDADELVRSKAVAGLGRLSSPKAVAPLRAAQAGARNAFISLLAVRGLARLGERVDPQAAQRALAQPDADARWLAIEVLESIGGDAAVENLELALADKEPRIQVRAAAALVRLLQRPAASGPAPAEPAPPPKP